MSNEMKSRPFDTTDYLTTPAMAAEYLNAAMADGDERVLLVALRNVAKAQGSVAGLSDETGLAREALYRMLSEDGNPRLTSLVSVLHALGLELSVKPRDAA